ncbi:MAG: hypothetical protein EBT26_05390 [Microbacteriaceae bacterium]|nr:hypothetical protein [Microbacteriaceae bacterium]
MAAGLGFKTFNTGDVLSAADVNGYLMQGVLVFADAAARDAAITSPQEGQFAYTKDTNGLWYYSGSAWVASGATGDIEGVTAGTGISGGGTSGTVTITNSMATAIDAKGDLIVGTGADTFSRLAVGTNNYVLTADSAEATGLKWAAASSGGFTTAIFHDAKSDTTAGGTFTSGAWRTRDLNTSQFNNITSCSLSSNQITLPAGTYQIWGFAPAFNVNRHQARFYNITDSTVTILGMSSYTRSGANAQTGYASIQGAFTIAGTKTFEFQHRCETTGSSNGFGVSADLGSGEIYAQLTISKVA